MTDVERSQTTAVAALYRFVRLDDYESMREPLLNFARSVVLKARFS